MKDSDLDMLKEQVRMFRGLPATREQVRKPVDRSQPPTVPPRPTLTSRRRAELQQRRMIVRCSDLKEKYHEYDRMMESANSGEIYRQLRDDAMGKTNEELDLQFERQELDNLRSLASRAKESDSGEFRDNQGSKLRFKHIRGEPIISGKFRDSYDDYMKPPFMVPRKIIQPKIYNLPKIDKNKEIWFVPVDDDDSIPLHTQPKSPDPNDKRSRKQRARPEVKPGTRTPASEWRDRKGQKPKRPPWNFAGSCPPNIGWFK